MITDVNRAAGATARGGSAGMDGLLSEALAQHADVFSAPIGYVTRPYILYRSKDEPLGSRAPKRGWERVR